MGTNFCRLFQISTHENEVIVHVVRHVDRLLNKRLGVQRSSTIFCRAFHRQFQLLIETRGLWRMNGDFMGGPFLSYTIYDEKNDRILTIESLLYGPTAKKRNVVLEMEAMMRSIKL